MGSELYGDVRFGGKTLVFWCVYVLMWVSIIMFSQTRTRSAPLAPPKSYRPIPIWNEKPVLGYFLLTESTANQLLETYLLTDGEILYLKGMAQQEQEQLRVLETESLIYILDERLNLMEKRQKISDMAYNERVDEIVMTNQLAVREKLKENTYRQFNDWIETQWRHERELHGVLNAKLAARTYQIFATRYDSGGKYIVALPDKCLKFANAGNHMCDADGYAVGQDYTVYLSYKKSTGATVLEAGPWNIDDNYWSGWNDPQPRRMFADLAVGMPEAQAAYFNGYNGGVDQYGRKVTAPFGIDLAPEVSEDIGLMGAMNDWITITFMWTEGWGTAGSGGGTSQPSIVKVEVATPNPDGSIVHEVQNGQTLWYIADSYQVTLQTLLVNNGLTKDTVIIPGQKLIIQPADTSGESTQGSPTGSPTAGTRTSVAPKPTQTAKVYATQTKPATLPSTVDGSIEPDQSTVSKPKTGSDLLFYVIVVIFGLGTLLVLVGTLSKKKG